MERTPRLEIHILASSTPTTLMEAMTVYRASIRAGDLEVITRELHRFSLWCGPDRELTALSPALISEYAEQVGGTGTTPLAASRLQALRGFLSYARKKRMVPENLAQHVRIPKRKAGSRARSDNGKGSDRVELTPEGHARLTNQLEGLQAERAPLAAQIRRAAADKDVRENAPLEAAREQLGLVESRIRGIEASLRAAVVIQPDASVSDTVRIGSVVSLKDLETGREMVYTLVDRTEANPSEGRISDVSPIGKMAVRKTRGDEIEVETPRGKTRYLITEVSA